MVGNDQSGSMAGMSSGTSAPRRDLEVENQKLRQSLIHAEQKIPILVDLLERCTPIVRRSGIYDDPGLYGDLMRTLNPNYWVSLDSARRDAKPKGKRERAGD